MTIRSSENPLLYKGRNGGVWIIMFFKISPHPSLVRRGISFFKDV